MNKIINPIQVTMNTDSQLWSRKVYTLGGMREKPSARKLNDMIITSPRDSVSPRRKTCFDNRLEIDKINIESGTSESEPYTFSPVEEMTISDDESDD